MDLLIGPGWVDCRIGRGLTLDWEIGQQLVVRDWAKIEIASADGSAEWQKGLASHCRLTKWGDQTGIGAGLTLWQWICYGMDWQWNYVTCKSILR